MPKDDKRKELTQEEIDAQNEKFRTFFSTSVAQVPEEMKVSPHQIIDVDLTASIVYRCPTEPQGPGQRVFVIVSRHHLPRKEQGVCAA